MNDLPGRGSHIHLIAICGVGMASLAGLLQSQDYRVTGSDQNVYPPMSTYLERLGIQVLSGFTEEHLRERPQMVVIGNAVARNNRDLEHLKGAFRHLMEIIPPAGTLLACNEYEAAREVALSAGCPVLFYGNGEPGDWQARNIRARAGCSLFEPFYKGSPEGVVELSLIGRHHVNNALAVYATARELGIDQTTLKDALAVFSGVKRRQEVKGEVGGVTVIDDFAHHPTAIKETIEAVRAAYPGRRLWAIFEPRSNTSRRRIFAREFPQALSSADRVGVAGGCEAARN